MKRRDSLSPSSAWAVWLIHRAARRSPPALAERLAEEWLADLSAHSGTVSRLRFALGCCWATLVINFDPVSFGAPVAHATAGPRAVATFAPFDSAWFSRRTTVLLLIVGVHVFVVYGFSRGLGGKVIEALPPEIRGRLIDDRPPIETPPPLIKPTQQVFTPIRPELAGLLPGPLGPITYPPDPPVSPPKTIDPAPEPVPVKRVIGGPGAGFPSTEDHYPAISRRLGETGVTVMQVCVDRRGRLAAVPQVKDSSGSARLDAAAMELAQAGSGHYRSTTEDGQPVESCYPFRIRFSLRY